mmetsp:Transcript_23260/g.78145  ORF Transcript_23260/g.78145 Transcript_23260/m.78145 type:complete len:207 (+) Transcript_23260:539-1159(+)
MRPPALCCHPSAARQPGRGERAAPQCACRANGRAACPSRAGGPQQSWPATRTTSRAPPSGCCRRAEPLGAPRLVGASDAHRLCPHAPEPAQAPRHRGRHARCRRPQSPRAPGAPAAPSLPPQSLFFLKLQPSVSRALPPVGWHSTVEHEPQTTTVCAWLNTVVMLKHPGHFTSMKKELGLWILRLSLCLRASTADGGWRRSTSPMP